LGVSVAMLLYLLAFGDGARNFLRRNLSAFSPQILILPKEYVSSQPLLPRGLADTLREMKVGKVFSILRLPYMGGFPPKAMGVVMGRDFSSSMRFITDYEILRGRDIGDSTRREALVGRGLAKVLGLKVGDSLTVATGRYVVVGIMGGEAELIDNTVIVPLNLLMRDLGTDRVLAIAVSPPPERLNEALDSLKAVLPNYTVQTSRWLADLANSMVAFGDALRLSLSLVSLFVSAVLLFAVMSITVQERRWEFALLRALGATRRFLLASVVGQSALVSLAGWLLGSIVGLLLVAVSDRMIRSRFGLDLLDVSPSSFALSFALAMMIGVLGGLLPAMALLRSNIREGLGG